MSADSHPPFPWPWSLPSVAILIAMGTWGTMVYSDLPELVPRHIGPNGVDAWSRKSVGSAFVPLFLYVGVTMLMVGTAVGIARTTPDSELPRDRPPGVVNRPATRSSATRLAKSVLVLNTALGMALLPLCAIQWRTTQTPEVSWWPLPVALGLITAGSVPLIVAGLRDRSEKA